MSARRAALQNLEGMFPTVDSAVVADVLREARYNQERAADFLVEFSASQSQTRPPLDLKPHEHGEPGLFQCSTNGVWAPVMVAGPTPRAHRTPRYLVFYDHSDRVVERAEDKLRRWKAPTDAELAATLRALRDDESLAAEQSAKVEQRFDDVRSLADMFRHKSAKKVMHMFGKHGCNADRAAQRLAAARIGIPDTDFGVGGVYEGRDARGKWWPITVVGRSDRAGLYAVRASEEGGDKEWPRTNPDCIRMQVAASTSVARSRTTVPAPAAAAAAATHQHDPPRRTTTPAPAPAAAAAAPARRSSAPPASRREPPGHLMCPISMHIMTDPYITKYGHSFEKRVLLEWVKENRRCPLTQQPLTEREVFPNRALRAMIEEWDAGT